MHGRLLATLPLLGAMACGSAADARQDEEPIGGGSTGEATLESSGDTGAQTQTSTTESDDDPGDGIGSDDGTDSTDGPGTSTGTDQPPGASNFEARCNATGVVLCEGFDDEASFGPWVQPAGDGVVRALLDPEVFASGGGSLRFEIPPMTGANSSGAYDIVLPQAFAEHTTFYVQFRQRFTQEMMDADFSGGGWKQSIFCNHSASCAAIEITTVNGYSRDFPTMYDRCGEGFDIELPDSDFLLQWSTDWPEQPHPNDWVECHYHNQEEPPAGGCLMYRADDWMTFSYEIHVGTWGEADGWIKAWSGYDGEPLHQIMNQDPWIAYPNGDGTSGSDSYDRIILLPYNTGKDPSHDHPVAWTWYDELIVSTEPIAAPS